MKFFCLKFKICNFIILSSYKYTPFHFILFHCQDKRVSMSAQTHLQQRTNSTDEYIDIEIHNIVYTGSYKQPVNYIRFIIYIHMIV